MFGSSNWPLAKGGCVESPEAQKAKLWFVHGLPITGSGYLIPGRVADPLIGIYIFAVEMARVAFQRDG